MIAALRRFGPLAALVAVAAGAWASGLLHSLTPEGFALREAEIAALAAARPIQAVALFVAAYALLTAACLPVALLLSLLGGYVFGTWTATAALMVAATLSSLITYGAARSAVGPWMAQRLAHGGRLAGIVENIRRGTFFYTLSLRFVPVAPFGAINAAAGMARAPLAPFLGATVLGIAPACLIYAGLGAGLKAAFGSGPFDLHKAALKPELFLPLAGMGVLALIAGWFRSRRAAQEAQKG